MVSHLRHFLGVFLAVLDTPTSSIDADMNRYRYPWYGLCYTPKSPLCSCKNVALRG
jgi:hypothetical protein